MWEKVTQWPLIRSFLFRFIVLNVIYHLLTERIFYSFTGMIFEHKSFSGWVTLWGWHITPYVMIALIMTIQTEIIYQLLKRRQ